jgi:hypothetical protein
MATCPFKMVTYDFRKATMNALILLAAQEGGGQVEQIARVGVSGA